MHINRKFSSGTSGSCFWCPSWGARLPPLDDALANCSHRQPSQEMCLWATEDWGSLAKRCLEAAHHILYPVADWCRGTQSCSLSLKGDTPWGKPYASGLPESGRGQELTLDLPYPAPLSPFPVSLENTPR